MATRPRLMAPPRPTGAEIEGQVEPFPQFDLPVTLPPAGKSFPPGSSPFVPATLGSSAVLDALPPTSRVYRAGDSIAGKYELNRVLGQGGMGEVWVARNRDLDADVAIKLIRAESSSDDSADRLLREAQAAARLSGPAIVRVFDFGKTQFGDPFIVMELLEGEDLSHALKRRGRLSPTKAVRIMLPICQALATAHGVGIVHRDLKPENIFLAKTPGGQVQPKLLDFGVAKLGRGFSTRLTQTGAMLGSPLYMSPEHARGDEVDYRADIWAFCVVMYEVITGRAPFDGKNYNAVLYSIIANNPPATTTFGAGDDELWHCVERGMRKDPDLRWSSMNELGRALAGWLMKHDTLDDITGVSLQATWFETPARPSVDPLETVRPPGGGGDPLLEPGKFGMPGVPSFRGMPTVRRQVGKKAVAARLLRHPLILSALIGLLGAVLVVLAVKNLGNETTVGPGLSRVRELAKSLRPTEVSPPAEASAAPVVASAEPPLEAALPATSDTAATPEARPSALPAGNTKRPPNKRPPVSKLKNPFD